MRKFTAGLLAAASLPLLLSGCATRQYMGFPYNSTTCRGDCHAGEGTIFTNTWDPVSGAKPMREETGSFAMGNPNGLFRITEGKRTTTVRMENGVMHGPAEVITAQGARYQLIYRLGIPVSGKTIFDNGDSFDGSYQTLPRAGGAVTYPKQGIYRTRDGRIYEGRFLVLGDQLAFAGKATARDGRVNQTAQAIATPGERDAGFSFNDASVAQIESLKANRTEWKPALVTDLLHEVTGPRYFATTKLQHETYYSWRNVIANTGVNFPPSSMVARAGSGIGARDGAPSGMAREANPSHVSTPASYNLIEGNTGKYMSPFTSDGVAAGWVDKAISAKFGSSIGGHVGAYAGQKALEQVPLLGNFLGNKVGNAAGRSIALKAAGGEAYLRESSDLSFNDINDMARWLVATHAQHTKFKEILDAACQIYPELRPAVQQAQVTRR